jgi:hypothetical protein
VPLIISAAALTGLFVALFAAPLVLGSYVVIQHQSPRWQMLWFGLLTALLLLSLLAAILGLALALLLPA